MQLIGLILNFIGTVLLAIGAILPNKEIEQLSTQYFGGRPDIKYNLIKNKNLAIIGIIVNALGFLFQIIGALKT
jgi:hypothetical protein